MLRLEVGTRRPPLVEEVIAVIAVKQERRPSHLLGVQAPVFDRRHHVHRPQPEAHRLALAAPAAHFGAQPVAQVGALVGEIAGGAEHPENVEAQMGVPGEPPVECRSEHDRQAFHAVEGAAGRQRQRRAGFGGPEGQLGLGVAEAAPQIRRVRQRLARDAVGQGVAVFADFAPHPRAGRAAHRAADHEQVARHLGGRGQGRVAVDDEDGALHPALDQHGPAPHRHVAAPLVAARQVCVSGQPRRAGSVVEPDRFLRHHPRQLRGHEVHPGALGVDDDGRVLPGERQRAREADEEQECCTHGWDPR